jgi:cell division initiation protein
MLTPQEITEKKFVKAVFGGYDMTEVDDFLAELNNDYAVLYKENAILKGKLKVLVEKVEEYRSTEDSMRMALLTAQRMGDEIIADANKKKDAMLYETELERREIIEKALRSVSDEEQKLSVAAKETAKFIELSKMIISKHSDFLSKLESARKVVMPQVSNPTPPPPVPKPLPTREERIAESATAIDNAMQQLETSFAPIPQELKVPSASEAQPTPEVSTAPTSEDEAPATPTAPAAPAYDDEGEPTKPYTIKDKDKDKEKEKEDSVSPRPKFDFDDLKFGSNFDVEI